MATATSNCAWPVIRSPCARCCEYGDGDDLRYDFDDTRLARSHVNRSHPFSAEPFKP